MTIKLLGQSKNHYSDSSGNHSTKTHSALKPSKHLINFFNEFNNFFSQQNKDNENIISCKY